MSQPVSMERAMPYTWMPFGKNRWLWLLVTLSMACLGGCRVGESGSTEIRESTSPTSMPVLESVSERPFFAMYVQDFRHPLSGRTTNNIDVIVAVFRDGRVIYSHDLLNGGAPYGTTAVGHERIEQFLRDLEMLKCLSSPEYQSSYFGPDSKITTITGRLHDRFFEMRSWHEQFECDDGLIVTDRGVESLKDRTKAEVSKKTSPEYERFRTAWDKLRQRAAALLPEHRDASQTMSFVLEPG